MTPPLPQSEWPAFHAPTCATCGHTAGDHRGVSVPHSHFPLRGVCLRCDCKQYVDADDPANDLPRSDAA